LESYLQGNLVAVMVNTKWKKVALCLLAAGAFLIGMWNSGPVQWSAFAVSLLAYASFVSLHHRGLPLPYRNHWQLLLDICNVLFLIYFMLWYVLPARYTFHSWPIQLLACTPMIYFSWKVSSFRFHREDRAVHGECLDCGVAMSADQANCSGCGKSAAPSRTCAECGKTVPTEFPRCPACREVAPAASTA
jgi:hypothetical protein